VKPIGLSEAKSVGGIQGEGKTIEPKCHCKERSDDRPSGRNDEAIPEKVLKIERLLRCLWSLAMTGIVLNSRK
jgi:hypothetical protein